MKDRVDLYLRQSQEYRDSDKKLLMRVWWDEGLQLTDEQMAVFMRRCSSAESITRIRRALKDKYPASEMVDNQRFEKYLDHKYNRPYEYVVSEED